MQTSFKYLIVVCVILLSSCSLQKRLYNKGFYASKTHSLKKTERKLNTDTLPSVLSSIKSNKVKEVPVTLSAEASNKIIEIKHTKAKPTLLTDGCDTLFLRNGAQILVKVSEINPEQIKFRYCNSPNEVLRVIDKNDVNYIVYATGLKEVIEYKPNVPYYYLPPRKVNPFAIVGFTLSIFDLFLSGSYSTATISAGIGLASIIAFALLLITTAICVYAIIQITKNRETQRGMALAIIGLILSLILLMALLL